MGKRQDLLEAARNGNVAVVKKILETVAKKSGPLSSFRRSPSINGQDCNGYTPLHHASLNGHCEIVQMLLSCHEVLTDINDIRGSTPLYLAAWAGHDDIVRLLLRRPVRPANPNAQTIDNETALHCAAQHGHSTVLGSLLSFGADPSIRNNSFQTPLDLASQFGRLKSVEILIHIHPELIEPFRNYIHDDNDSNDNDNDQDRGNPSSSPVYTLTPTQHIFTHSCLHLAARNGHNDVVETLLRAGVDPNILTSNGTALHEAATSGRKAVVCTLLRSGTDPEIMDAQGRTVLDVLKGYPPHIIYDIVSIIKEFCQNSNEMDNKTHFMPVKEIHDESKTNSGEYEHFEDFGNENSNKLSHKKRIQLKENYMDMKPSKEFKTNTNHSTTIGNIPNIYKMPFKKPIAFKMKPQNELSIQSICKGNVNCTDEYVEMMDPNNNNNNNNDDELTPTSTPLPNDERFLSNNLGIMNIPIDTNNNYTNVKTSSHSPTPEFPPPSVRQAENTIFELMKPTSSSSSCNRMDRGFYEELRSFIWKNREETNTESLSSSRLSEYVEDFVSDVPFAGLFKGSSLNLNKDSLENSRNQSSIEDLSSLEKISSISVGGKRLSSDHNDDNDVDDDDRSRNLIKDHSRHCSILNLNSSKTTDSFDFDVTKAWEEINNIFESIGKSKISQKTNLTKLTIPTPSANDVGSPQVNQEEEEVKSPLLPIRKPIDLLLSTAPEEEQRGFTSKWCHAANSLIYGYILYHVFYLGSTVIRGLHGVASTRKSIQRLKLETGKGGDDWSTREQRSVSSSDETGLLNNIKSSTHALKETNQQSRQEVGIALSHCGVRFIDLENKKTICQHDVENINCVCQDPDDLRYFAYMTREAETYYCHVFMVDDIDLAKEIILTLGQVFEVAYQLVLACRQGAINKEEFLD